MFYVKIHTPTSHCWLVKKYVAISSSGGYVKEKFIPRPDLALIFHFGNSPSAVAEEEVKLAPYFAAPILPRNMLLVIDNELDTFIAICKPTVASRCFGITFESRLYCGIPLPSNLFQPLHASLAAKHTFEERIETFEHFLTEHTSSGPYEPDIVDQFYDEVISRGCHTHLKTLMKECTSCPRTLQRSFLKRTGVSAKTLMRIARINYLWKKIRNDKAVSYQDLAFFGNYFDLPHFINDFKAITGETPHYFFKRNHALRLIMSGREEGML